MFNKSLGLFGVAAVCVGLVSYSGIKEDTIRDVFGDSEVSKMITDLPKDIGGVIKQVYDILGDPRDNFQRAMTGFENAAHRNNPGSHGHGDYSRIYEVLDINNIIAQLKTLKDKGNRNKPDSVIIYESYMPDFNNIK